MSPRSTLLISSIIVLLLAGAGFADDETKPTPTPTVAPAAGTPTPAPAPSTLAGLAAEMQRKKKANQAGQPQEKIVISNENLADYADKGNITTAKPAVPPPQAPPTKGTNEENEKREYWRKAYSDQLELIAKLEAEIEALDSEIPRLWTDFYSRDDPAYRDGVIKPKLDEALLRRQQLEEQLQEERQKPAQILEQARKDGALPGWFRDLK